jgi:TatD DNase family protein
MIDTHVHFSELSGDYTRERLMERAAAAGVEKMVAVGGSCELNKSAAEAAESFPDRVSVAIGFDRSQISELNSPALIEDAIGRLRRSVDALRKLRIHVCAIGEIGLDYHYTPETKNQQLPLFAAQCALAADLKLPVIVHSREADADTLQVLTDYKAKCGDRETIGVLHCFTGNAEFAGQLLALGMMISFSGIVTFLNADTLRAVATTVPPHRLLIETDSPYLAPVPHRGKRNEPAFVRDVAVCLAEVRGETVDQVECITTQNAIRLFKI